MSSLAAITTQQGVGIAVVVALLVGWIAYIVVSVRRREEPPGAEVELAPNRKAYYDDETLETKKLDRSLGWALVLLVITGLGLPLYWLNEPGRQAGAADNFDQRSVDRGESLFQPTDSPEEGAHFGCGTCHGSEGQGGVVRFSIDNEATEEEGDTRVVQWQAPAVNTAGLRFSEDELRKILVYGRANSPMPAWGVEGGGPMNAQQIDDLVNYLKSIEITPEEAQTAAVEQWGENDGELLFNNNCARYHTKGWSYGEPEVPAGGAYGPNLRDGATLRQFPAREDHVEFIVNGAEYAEPYGVRGVGDDAGGGMPGFGSSLTEAQIGAIVDYERGLGE